MNFWTWVALLCGLGAVTIGLSMVATWLLDRRAFRAVDADMRADGHVPAEDDPEITAVIRAIERDDDLDHGRHSSGAMRIPNDKGYEGAHRPRIGCVFARDLVGVS